MKCTKWTIVAHTLGQSFLECVTSVCIYQKLSEEWKKRVRDRSSHPAYFLLYTYCIWTITAWRMIECCDVSDVRKMWGQGIFAVRPSDKHYGGAYRHLKDISDMWATCTVWAAWSKKSTHATKCGQSRHENCSALLDRRWRSPSCASPPPLLWRVIKTWNRSRHTKSPHCALGKWHLIGSLQVQLHLWAVPSQFQGIEQTSKAAR